MICEIDGTTKSRRMAEPGYLRVLGQVAEIRATHMHERPVVASFEIDVARPV